jgi:HD-GYP domain-containing protein (c-di-GMP phosphodiesterase class II)
MSFIAPSFTTTTQAGAQSADGEGVAFEVSLIQALARTMTGRDPSMQQHAEQVRCYAVALAGEVCLGDHRLIEAIEAAAVVHDLGKLGVPDRLLQKPGPLTRDEYEQVKQHAVIGADLLSAVGIPGLASIVRHHHENWDGSGYPDGLRGEDIPLGARVLSIVDCYDALTSDRPYRRALPHAVAVTMIQERRGTMYDPVIADAFLRIVRGLQPAPAKDRGGRLLVRAGDAWLPKARAV